MHLFTQGDAGYHTFRIPALVRTPRGTLLAFAEGRRHHGHDTGKIDTVLRRSTDDGDTWGPIELVWADGENTFGNPCPIVDAHTGVIHLLSTWNLGSDAEPQIIDQTSADTRRVFATHSSDDGRTWATPVEITAVAKRPDWTWYATGPGAGIQLERGSHAGRLVAPCDHIEAATRAYYSHVLLSDDHGQSWYLGGRTPSPGVNECEVVERTDGSLLLNMRNYRNATERCRQTALSHDAGQTWHDQRPDPALIEPRCQASIRRCAWPQAGRPGIIAFSNPADRDKRRNMTVRFSYDDAQTWPAQVVLEEAFAAYSDLTPLPHNRLACLYESRTSDGRLAITLARIDTPTP